MFDRNDGEASRFSSSPNCPFIALESRSKQVDLNPGSIITHLSTERRAIAGESGGAQDLHRSEQIARQDQQIDVLRESLVAVLDDGESSGNGERDSSLAEDSIG